MLSAPQGSRKWRMVLLGVLTVAVIGLIEGFFGIEVSEKVYQWIFGITGAGVGGNVFEHASGAVREFARGQGSTLSEKVPESAARDVAAAVVTGMGEDFAAEVERDPDGARARVSGMIEALPMEFADEVVESIVSDVLNSVGGRRVDPPEES